MKISRAAARLAMKHPDWPLYRCIEEAGR